MINKDGELESMNDKCAACILLQKGLTTLSENLRSKILTLEDVELHEEMIDFLVNIHRLIYNVIRDYTKTKLSDYAQMAMYYPRIKQARQMSNFSILSSIISMLEDLRKKKFFESCNKVYVLNHFLQTLTPSMRFLKKFLLAYPHFHVQMPVPLRQTRRKPWQPFY